MTEKLPRKFTFRTVVWIVLAAAAVSFALSYLSKDAVDKMILGEGDTKPGDDTPIIVRDGSIVIASRGADIQKFSKLGDHVLVHPTHGKALGAVKVNGASPKLHCAGTQLCGFEFVWYSGTEGQPGYQEYRVYLWSGSPQSKGANIYSSVPFTEYTHTPKDPADPSLSTLSWPPAGGQIEFRSASVIEVPAGSNSADPPLKLCDTAKCEIKVEYK